MNWFYAIDGKQTGPVDESALMELAANGTLKPADFVWNETMGAQWQPAGSVSGLFPPPSAGAPPPIPVRPLPAGEISCVHPVSLAWDRMVATLFRPFSFARWFALGFSAWLATLAENRLGGFNFPANFNGLGDMGQNVPDADVWGAVNTALVWLRSHLGLIVLGAAIVVLLGLAIGLTLMWVRCRGKFMFLDNLVRGTTDTTENWVTFREHANSLFKWNLVFALVQVLAGLAFLLLVALAVAMPCIRARAFLPGALLGLIPIGLAAIAYGAVVSYIALFLESFIVPLMYRHDLSATEAWQRFGPLFRKHRGAFILYGLFYLVLGMGAGAMVVLAVLLTCCIGACVLAIPYVGAVALLPVTVFFRRYSLEYLRQFGPEFDVLTRPAE